MRYFQILNEVKVNKDSYDSVLNDPEIMFGFEVEIETNLVHPSYKRDTINVNASSWNEIRHLFKRRGRMDKAFSEWAKEHDANENDIGMFIRTQYGSNSAACHALEIIPEHGWSEDEGYVHTEEDPYASDRSHLETIATEISNYLNVQVDDAQTSTDDTWAVTTDPSLPRGGAEIISPPHQLSKGLEYLEKTFRYLNAKGFKTTSNTGIHINLSIRGKTITDYDFMKMILMFEERRAAELFDRIKSTYSKQMQPMLDSILKQHNKTGDLATRNAKFLLDKLKNIGSDENFFKKQFNKHFSINNRGNGVFEFRNIGGENYHQKFDDIKHQTIQMANILLVGSNENLYAKDYLTKFQRIILNNNQENSIPNMETFSKFFTDNPNAKSWVKILLNGKPVADNTKMRLALLMYHWANSQPNSKATLSQLSLFFKNIGVSKDFVGANSKDYKRKNVSTNDSDGDFSNVPSYP